jgi:hypothetical protein
MWITTAMRTTYRKENVRQVESVAFDHGRFRPYVHCPSKREYAERPQVRTDTMAMDNWTRRDLLRFGAVAGAAVLGGAGAADGLFGGAAVRLR